MAQGSSLEEDRDSPEDYCGVAEKLAGNNGSRSSLGIRPGLDDVVGPRWEFARRFFEGIKKLAGRSPKEDRMTYRKNAEGWAVEPPVPRNR
ncbi:hypothetical protein B296_00005584 [Ensete ventricosum]|uniref:Uncharacterized protein n=1 Tax=Ensete ventricosum TaxID=4639 RepID=A0A426Y494_ENSVE|nr:hypothetical protein B296_00005584 [Ensete ventricosum]